jgi:hypothetical protein
MFVCVCEYGCLSLLAEDMLALLKTYGMFIVIETIKGAEHLHISIQT